jgi:hypothetical protein
MKPDAPKPSPTVSLKPRRAAPGTGFELSHDAWGRLVLTDVEGQRFVGVEPVRAFPISHPTQWISLCDAEGHEVYTVAALDELAPAVRQILESELALREFIPVIKRIIRVSTQSFPCDWDVATDRGQTRFTVDHEEEIRPLGSSRVMITDTRKLRYHVPDVRALDAHSRHILERFL